MINYAKKYNMFNGIIELAMLSKFYIILISTVSGNLIRQNSLINISLMRYIWIKCIKMILLFNKWVSFMEIII